jgi:5'-nucleotidase
LAAILLTNDDGIHSAGITSLARSLSHLGQVITVAPDRERSASSQALTLWRPIRYQEVGVDRYSVEGTPADCVILALNHILPDRPDLVISGINRGSNLGWDVMVSGTVGAAFQGYFRGYPTIAISVGSVQNPRFDGAASLLRLMAQKLAGDADRNPFLLNVNVPSMAPDQITGLEITRPGGRSYGESVREEGAGHQKRYWIARNRPVMADNGEGTDMNATKNNRISVTPLHLNLSHQEALPRVESLLADVPEALLGKGGA